MPKYEDYPFYNLLLNRVSEPGNKVIEAVKNKIGSVVDYDTASDLVTYNAKQYPFDVFRSSIIADDLMNMIDHFKDNVDAINSYIEKWSDYITKIKISPMGCTTFLVMSSEVFVNENGVYDFQSKVSKYDKLAIHTNGIPDGEELNEEENLFIMVTRLGETDSEFRKNDHPWFSKLLEELGVDFGAINDFKHENKIISECGDIDIIINFNRPPEEDED